MKRARSESPKTTSGQRWSASHYPSATEYVRAAEKFVQTKHYHEALEQLHQAQAFEPNNKYIIAIMERVLALQRADKVGHNLDSQDLREESPDPNRYLSITVGPGFENGVKPPESSIPLPEETHQDLVREFTSIARGYVKIGLPEAAFNALMKAYLLDPVNPEVMSCEQEIIPIWNRFHGLAPIVTSDEAPPVVESPENEVSHVESVREPKGSPPAPALAHPEAGAETPDIDIRPLTVSFADTNSSIPDSPSLNFSFTDKELQDPMEQQTNSNATGSSELDLTNPGSTEPAHSTRSLHKSPEEEALRLEMLKQQKELRRQEKERGAYREASKLPWLLDDSQKDDPDFHLSKISGSSSDHQGFVRRLLKGRL